MADTETEQLVVSLEARIDAFEKNMAKASQTANTNWSAIEARGRQAGNRIRADMGSATAGIANSFKALNGSIIGSLGLTGAASAAGFLALAVKINGELAKMASLAKQAEISTDKLQEIKYAANINGVSDDDFATSLQQSLAMLEEAQHGVNDLKRLFNANGKSIRDSNGELIKFDKLLEIAADLISRAPTNEAKVKITEMMGLSRDWIRTLQGGPEAFRKMQQEAQSAGAVIDSATIAKAKEFDQAWTKAVVKFKAGITETLSDLSEAFAEFWQNVIDDVPGASYIVEKMRSIFGGLEGMTIPELKDALQRSIEQGVDKVEIDRIQAELDRKMNKKPLRIEIHPDVKGPPSVIPQEKQRNAFDSAVFETQKRIAATQAETASIGQNSEVRERAKTVAELETAAKRANTQAGFQNATVTDEQRQKINQLADALEAAAKRQRLAEEQFKGFNELLQQSGQTAIDFITKLGDRTANFRAMVNDVTKSLEKMALQAALLGQGPLAGIIGTQSGVPGGTGGILGALAGLFGGARAGGGDVDPGKIYKVGERGEELFAPKVPGTIIPNHKIGLGGGGVGRVGHTFNSHVTVNAGAGGGGAGANEDMAQRVGRSVREQFGSMMQEALNQQMRPGGTVWQMMQKGK